MLVRIFYFKCLIMFALTGGCFPFASGQNDLQTKFYEYQQNALQEKVFVHTDKKFYLTGETIWFKIYDVDGTFHKPLDLNKAVYVEVIDQRQNPVLQTRIRLEEGKGHGSFSIPQLNTGTYVLRAYTRWMKNFSEDYFFEKQLDIVNPLQETPGKPPGQNPEALHVTFFPEGGNLVHNLTSKIAFKATDKNGKGVEINGIIKNKNGETVVSFQSLKFGIGSFAFTPSVDDQCEAVITHNGKTSNHTIPKVYGEGYVMQVRDLNAEKLHVIVSSHSLSKSTETITLLVHTRQLVKVAVASRMMDGQTGFLVDKNKLGEGISHFTVFNGNQQPVCERLYFTLPKNKLIPDLKLESHSYSPRQKVNVAILTADKNARSVSASMSISVYRIDSLQTFDPENMLSYFLLTSDLKGHIESPDYYLSENDSLSNRAADNLMLTHGWRRFNWKDVLQKTSPDIRFAPEYEGVIVSGKIMHRKTQSSAANTTIYLSIPGTRPQFYTARTNGKGEFEFYVKDLVGLNEMVIQPASDAGQFAIAVDNPYAVKYSDRKLTSAIIPTGRNSKLLNYSIHTQVENYFKKGKSTFTTHQPDSSPFYRTPDKEYVLNDYERFSTIEEVLREYVPEVMVKKQDKKLNLFVLNKKAQAFFTEKPLILFDGIPILNDDKITSTNVRHIKKLGVVTKRYWLGPAMFNGILNFSTYKGDISGFELDSTIFVLDFEGLQLQREFYAPQFETTEQLKRRVPDFRNVLFWSPDITTDSAGKSQISFYTSDQKGTFVGVLHGITEEGLMGTTTFIFKVSD